MPFTPDRPTSYSRRKTFKISIYSTAPLPPISTMRRAVRPVAFHAPGRRRTARIRSMTHNPAAVPRLAWYIPSENAIQTVPASQAKRTPQTADCTASTASRKDSA